jgi:ribonuclease HII
LLPALGRDIVPLVPAKPDRPPPDRFAFERELLRQGIANFAGVDEAGRGPLAGPVVAAAVRLPTDWLEQGLPPELAGLNDSKQLSAAQRDRFFEFLTRAVGVHWGLAQVDASEIDTVNILQATHRAMNQALAQLRPPAQHALVDGRPVDSLALPQTALVQGDARSYSIAAASVLAKVTRDRLMVELDRQYPTYGFAVHKGYGTTDHLAALARHGPCPLHRRSFAPLKQQQLSLFDDGLVATD